MLNALNWRVVALHLGENLAERLREALPVKAILNDLEGEENWRALCAEIRSVQVGARV